VQLAAACFITASKGVAPELGKDEARAWTAGYLPACQDTMRVRMPVV
jgi:hypothetical protein